MAEQKKRQIDHHAGLRRTRFCRGLSPSQNAYLERGGKLLVCGPCMQSRKINPAEEFIEGATMVNATTFAVECTEAANVLIY